MIRCVPEIEPERDLKGATWVSLDRAGLRNRNLRPSAGDPPLRLRDIGIM